MPESVKNRPTNATEDVFLLAKSSSYYYNASAVRKETGANLRNYWILGPDPSNYGHPAAFPRELARQCILLGSKEGDCALDPFGGSGTTGFVANNLGRDAILIEVNPEYALCARERGIRVTTSELKTSIPLNIAKGNGKRSPSDRARFVDNARGVGKAQTIAPESRIERKRKSMSLGRNRVHGTFGTLERRFQVPLITRVIAVLALLAVAGFCGFGFMATFEPLDPSTQLVWRVVYGLVGLASLVGAIWAVLPRIHGP